MSITVTQGYDTVTITDDIIQKIITDYVTGQTGRRCTGFVTITAEPRAAIGSRRTESYTAIVSLENT